MMMKCRKARVKDEDDDYRLLLTEYGVRSKEVQITDCEIQ